MMSIEMIRSVVKEVLDVLNLMETFQIAFRRRIGKDWVCTYPHAASWYVYCKYSLIRVSSDVKQSKNMYQLYD